MGWVGGHRDADAGRGGGRCAAQWINAVQFAVAWKKQEIVDLFAQAGVDFDRIPATSPDGNVSFFLLLLFFWRSL